ncbi:MAG: hypothetical protein HOB79_08505 [Rhodospirillaceae bacterium]|jgi:hypothetical protein|nr:hypothetical protein [Rhodospirillales bacterium]MBT3906978.1 hypothetical protein [Rhodospirillaceae bacterium]MBT4701106.1 hypothetical protein [Rhodospirillaceae bacterium]MBT5033757.1 hypothetical protein [Rhodospirillaceae bacterium]MBT6219949.1 hypothetical protein [Rhodospirillaceae bacterium]
MEVKGLAYQSRQLDRSKDEHKAADFLAINPRGLVPVLKSEQNGQDVVVSEAIAILASTPLARLENQPNIGTTVTVRFPSDRIIH